MLSTKRSSARSHPAVRWKPPQIGHSDEWAQSGMFVKAFVNVCLKAFVKVSLKASVKVSVKAFVKASGLRDPWRFVQMKARNS